MAASRRRRLFVCFLALGLVSACEPITVVLPGGVAPPEDPLDAGVVPGEPGDEDDEGTRDGGLKEEPGSWSACEDGWQRKVVLPRGLKGDAYFDLTRDGGAYLVEYTGNRLSVRFSEPGVPRQDTGWVGLPWVAGLGVDDRDVIHVGMSAYDGGLLSQHPILVASNASGTWSFAQAGLGNQGKVVDFDVERDGGVAVLSVDELMSHSLVYATNRSGTFTSQRTGVEIGNVAVTAALRVDVGGRPHLTWQGMLSSSRGIYYATTDGGTWAQERLADAGSEPTLAVGPTGGAHILWMANTSPSSLWLATRTEGGGWQTGKVSSDLYPPLSAEVDAHGALHVLGRDDKDGAVLYLTNAGGTWRKTTLATTDRGRDEYLGYTMRLRLDAAGRVHVMYPLISPNADGGTAKRIEYARQCPEREGPEAP